MSENKGHTNADYLAVYERLGSMKAVAREMGVNESTVRRSLNRLKKRDPAMQRDGCGRHWPCAVDGVDQD
jgi:predicted ArsR family transcriptional regulator